MNSAQIEGNLLSHEEIRVARLERLWVSLLRIALFTIWVLSCPKTNTGNLIHLIPRSNSNRFRFCYFFLLHIIPQHPLCLIWQFRLNPPIHLLRDQLAWKQTLLYRETKEITYPSTIRRIPLLNPSSTPLLQITRHLREQVCDPLLTSI